MKVSVSARSQVTLGFDRGDVFVDGEKVGTLRNHETIEVELPDDAKTMIVGTPVYSSKPLDLPTAGGRFVVERAPTLRIRFLVAAMIAGVLWWAGFTLQFVLPFFVATAALALFFRWNWRIRRLKDLHA